MTGPQPLILSREGDRCEIYPQLGGSIARWVVAGQDMFRAASPQAIAGGDLFGMATFPLVPFSNRIGHGRFAWNGRTEQLTPNFAPEPHAIHGVGWMRRWQVARLSEQSVALTYSHTGDAAWPWPFDAEQDIVLGDGELILTLRATNRADTAVPLGFGHHPYFDQAGATMTFASERVWMSDAQALPSAPEPPAGQFDFAAEAPVAGRDIDHCYAGVSGPAVIRWEGRPRKLEITSHPQLPAAVVYVPKGGDAFCFEPVPHINNALNLTGHEPAMPVLEPGAASQTIIRFVTRQS